MGTLCSFFEKKSNNTNIGMMNIYAHPWILSLLDIVMNWVPEIIIRIRFCFVLFSLQIMQFLMSCYFLKLLTEFCRHPILNLQEDVEEKEVITTFTRRRLIVTKTDQIVPHLASVRTGSLLIHSKVP